jgi:hypothetical protein
MSTYGFNRIFRHAQFGTVNWNSGNNGTVFFEEAIQALSSDIETRVLNDLDEKFHDMATLAMYDPSIVRMIDSQAYPNKREVR